MAPRRKRKTSTTQKRTATRKKPSSKKKKRAGKKGGGTKRDLLIAFALLCLVALAGLFYYRNGEGHSAGPVTESTHSGKASVLDKKRIAVKTPKRRQVEEIERVESASISERIDRQRREAMRAGDAWMKRKGEKEISMPKQTALSRKRERALKSPLPRGYRRPKLVIIIDDVSNPGELKAIRSIPLKLTPSLFPPSKFSPKTAQMAKGLRHYMVHFPMQAGNYPHGAMPATLRVGDSRAKMRVRVKALRRWFPDCIYTNNHTGSVFTSDYKALYTLYGLLKEQGFVFLDSRTSSRSQGKKVAKAYGDFYLHRDVFIDNTQQFGAIRKQLKIAVKKAKKRGYAIAIGHPHAITIRSLKNSLDILVDVDVVYLDELIR